MIKRSLSLTLGFILAWVIAAHAVTTYYVAKTGNDINPCSTGSPCLTINHGASLMSPGDTLIVRVGTYAEEILNPPGGSSWGTATTIMADPGATVLVQPTSCTNVMSFLSAGSTYVIVDHLHLDAINCSGNVIKIEYTTGLGYSDHIRIQNTEIKNAGPGSGGGVVQGVLVIGCCNEFISDDVHDNGTIGQEHFTHGFYITSDNNIIRNSNVYANLGYGIHLYNGGCGSCVHDNQIYSNLIYSNNTTNAGAIITSGCDNLFYNNVLVANHWGLQIDYSACNTIIANNSIGYNLGDAGGYAVYISSNGVSGTVFKNNISYGNGTDTPHDDAGDTTYTTNLIGTNPSWVDGSNGNMRLQAGSVAINAGTNSGPATTDILGVARPQGTNYDEGAYEYVFPKTGAFFMMSSREKR